MKKLIGGIVIGAVVAAGAGAIYHYREPIGNWFYDVFHYEQVETDKEIEELPETVVPGESELVITLNTSAIWQN